MQLEKINPKMSFWKAKQGLSKTWDLKTKIGLILGGEQKVKGEKKRRGRGRRRREGGRSSQGEKDYRTGNGNSTGSKRD